MNDCEGTNRLWRRAKERARAPKIMRIGRANEVRRELACTSNCISRCMPNYVSRPWGANNSEKDRCTPFSMGHINPVISVTTKDIHNIVAHDSWYNHWLRDCCFGASSPYYCYYSCCETSLRLFRIVLALVAVFTQRTSLKWRLLVQEA